MANTVTLSSLRTQIRQRANMENSEFISDSELNGYINASYAELYDILVSRFEDYYTITASSTVSAGSFSFSVPADFYKVRGVDRLISGTEYYSLKGFNFSERNAYNNSVTFNYFNQIDIRYRLIGNNIELTPQGSAAGTYRLWYIPTYTALSLDADTVDGVNGWEEYIIVDACIKCLEKEESSTTMFEKQKKALLKRIEEMASQRDINNLDRITDVYIDDEGIIL